MNPIHLQPLLDDVWPMILGSSVGATVALLFLQRKPDVIRLRKTLAASLHDFASVPAEKLDAALAVTAAGHRRGWGMICPLLAIVFTMTMAGLAAQVYRQGFPEQPQWYGPCIAGAVAGFLAWPMILLERRALKIKIWKVLGKAKRNQRT